MALALLLFSLRRRRSMARPYSIDLRERVLQAHEAGEGSQRVLAERFSVSVGTVCGWLGLVRREGRRIPRAHRRGRRALGGADPQVLVGLVAEQNDATLAQYRARLAERTGVRVSEAAVCRALTRLGLSRKKDPARLGANAPRRRGRAGSLAR
jgi:putative transposase